VSVGARCRGATDAIKALEPCHGNIRHELVERLQLAARSGAALTLDLSQEHVERIERLLKEAKTRSRPRLKPTCRCARRSREQEPGIRNGLSEEPRKIALRSISNCQEKRNTGIQNRLRSLHAANPSRLPLMERSYQQAAGQELRMTLWMRCGTWRGSGRSASGTLIPLATGVLVLLLGKATRLVRFLCRPAQTI